MNEFDELQSLRNEVAKLRQECGDLGEKLGAAYNDIAILRGIANDFWNYAQGWDIVNMRGKIDFALKRTDPLTRNKQQTETK